MAYLNEVDATTLTDWLDNFDNYSSNIYDPFQNTPIKMARSTYDAICKDSSIHINIYFGLDPDGDPKMIAVGSYLLDDFDGEETTGFADILEPDAIYELYSNTVITKEDALVLTSKWRTNHSGDDLFKKSFLLPRPNFVKIFLEDEATEALIFFGMDDNNELKVMEKDPNGGPLSLVFNLSYPCPATCPKQGLLS